MNEKEIFEQYKFWSRLRFEQDGRAILSPTTAEDAAEITERLKNSEIPSESEPSDLPSIVKLCEFGIKPVPVVDKDKVYGALVGRFAGCVLGVPVEGWKQDEMRSLAKDGGTPFPPTEYWHTVKNPDGIQYGVNRRDEYTLSKMNCVPVDDDVTYTILNFLLLKEYGLSYSLEDVAKLWKAVVPYACTAEDCAIRNIRAGVPAEKVAEGNPFIEWIGAAIRADAFGYAYAGDPVGAAKLCYNDAYLTHRRNGIYGEMFCAAAVASAFKTKTALEALKEAIKCVPKGSRLYNDLVWAFRSEGKFDDYITARKLLDERFDGMSSVHTDNNMCAIVFAVMLGKNDLTLSIANAVAIGLDNDCTAATVGSIVGANVGLKKVDKKWYAPFNDAVTTYLTGYEKLSLNYLADEFISLRKKSL